MPPRHFWLQRIQRWTSPARPEHTLLGHAGSAISLAAHGGAVHAAIFQLLLHKVGVGEPAHTADRQLGKPAHLVAELQKTALRPKFRVVFRRNGVGELPVVGQGHMEAGDPRLLQQGNKDG